MLPPLWDRSQGPPSAPSRARSARGLSSRKKRLHSPRTDTSPTPPTAATSARSWNSSLIETSLAWSSADHGSHAETLGSSKLTWGAPTQSRSNPEESSQTVAMVKEFWQSIKAPLLGKHPQQLETALREAHGAPYLRVVRRIRKSSSLKATERHVLETDLAARLVRARAVLGQWQAGVQEMHEARRLRDPVRLREALGRWDFAEDDPVIADSKADLERWQTLSATLPSRLKHAMEEQDMQQLREVVSELSTAPHDIKGSVGARELLDRYDSQTRAIDDATTAGNTKAIQQQLAAWQFSEDAAPVQRAKAALNEREMQMVRIRLALETQDGKEIAEAVRMWRFEKDEPSVKEAREVLDRYERAVADLERLRREGTPTGYSDLAKAVAAWEFDRNDPTLRAAESHLESYQEVVQAALRERDGWAVEGLWASCKATAAMQAITEDALQLLKQYRAAVHDLQGALAGSTSFEPRSRSSLEQQVNDWDFAENDPHVEVARLWLRLQNFLEKQHTRLLHIATESGCADLVEKALACAQGLGEKSEEIVAAEQVQDSYHEALQAVGAEALGVDTSALHVAVERAAKVDEALKNLFKSASGLDKASLAELRAMQQPPADVMAVVQMFMHLLGGIDPRIRSPPRDTEWRSCQRMLSNPSGFLGYLDQIPDCVASEHYSGLRRAEAIHLRMRGSLGKSWSQDAIGSKSAAAGRLFEYLQHLFALAASLQGAATCRRASAKQSFLEVVEALPSDAAEDSSATDGAESFTLPSSIAEASNESGMVQEAMAHQEVADSPEHDYTNGAQAVEAETDTDDAESRADTEGSWNGSVRKSVEHAAPLLEQLVDLEAEGSVAGSAVLAAAWVIHGGSTDIFELVLTRLRKTLATLQSYVMVGEQVLLKSTELQVKNLLGEPKPGPPVADSPTHRTKHGRHADLTVSVRFLEAAHVNAELAVDKHRAPRDLRQLFEETSGIPADEEDYAFFHGASLLSEGRSFVSQAIPDGALLVLVRRPFTFPSLVQVLNLGLSATARPQRVLRSRSTEANLLQRQKQDPVLQLLQGPERGAAARARQASSFPVHPQSGMMDVSHAVVEYLRHAPSPSSGSSPRHRARNKASLAPSDSPAKLQYSSAPVQVNAESVKNMCVPLLNLAAAKRAASMSTRRSTPPGNRPAVMKDTFLQTMSIFYLEWLPQSVALTAGRALIRQTQVAMTTVQRTLDLIKPFGTVPTSTADLDGVSVVSSAAAKQLEALASQGLAFPIVHVECARQALDKAGAALLANQPGPDPGLRLRWAEEAMALQLAPMPHFSSALSNIARKLDVEELREPVRSSANGVAPQAELVRLVSAALWVVQPDCHRDCGWVDVKGVLEQAKSFVQSLVDWTPLRDADLPRLSRAHQLLLEVWHWVASGCGGSSAYGALFAWVSLAVGLRPLLEKAQKLAPLHIAVKQSIQRIDKAPADKRAAVQDRAWTSALFLFDGAGDKEAWWWLGLIRCAHSMEPPWMEGEDGSVADEGVVWEPQVHDAPATYASGEGDEDDDLEAVYFDTQDGGATGGPNSPRSGSSPTSDVEKIGDLSETGADSPTCGATLSLKEGTPLASIVSQSGMFFC